MTITETCLTAEDLFNLPPDNMRHELVKGEFTTMPPSSGEHGVRTFNIAALLGPLSKEITWASDWEQKRAS